MTAQNNGIGNPNRPPVTQRPPKKESTFGKIRKPLKRTKTKRPISPIAMFDLTQQVMLRDGRCVVGEHCDGMTDAHHLIGQRVLKMHYPAGHPIFVDDRNVVALCRRHHSLAERHLLIWNEDWTPLGFPAFLREFGFDAFWDGEIARRVG